MKELRYNLSCRLFTDVKCFGPGVAQLLHRVERLHSLRAAAMEMEMAYSKAWTVMKNSENALGFKLLAFTTGVFACHCSLSSAGQAELAALR